MGCSRLPSAPEISPCALFGWCVCMGGCHSLVLQPCSKGTRASAHVNIVGFKRDNAHPKSSYCLARKIHLQSCEMPKFIPTK